jgi:hypothetical protein
MLQDVRQMCGSSDVGLRGVWYWVEAKWQGGSSGRCKEVAGAP